MRVRCEAEGSTQHEIEKTAGQRQKTCKILAAMLVFLLCGCNHRDTEYKLSDSTGGSTAETVFGNQKEVDEEQTVSEKALEKPQAFRKNVRHRRQHRKKQCRFISAVRSLPPVSTRCRAEAA